MCDCLQYGVKIIPLAEMLGQLEGAEIKFRRIEMALSRSMRQGKIYKNKVASGNISVRGFNMTKAVCLVSLF